MLRQVPMFIRYKNYMYGRDMIDWNIEEYSGYKPFTTYYTDFGIAEWYGESAIKDTYKRAIKYWGEDIKWVTEIYMVLNFKIWEHYGRNDKLARLYDSLWKKTQSYIYEHYEGNEEAIAYFYRITN